MAYQEFPLPIPNEGGGRREEGRRKEGRKREEERDWRYGD